MVPPKPSRAGDQAYEVLAGMGKNVLKSQIRRFSAFQKAALDGLPVYRVPGDANARIAWHCYEQAFRELLN